ncbi:hypothetical protein OJAV_G00114150 [Oryzias javanicus]|uniref:Uncharacterized protein n=1 Tax=Oryzias javanicus TaxID=123683 RepID=A0A3S2MUE8_ORYJA|nr:hypothetical protein OJAV_G00114150 [Oryzias javanicus]
MSRLQGLKGFISQRLTAAVEDILGHLEKTIVEYEEETERRHRDFLDVVLTAEMKQQGTDIQEQFARKRNPSAQQRRSRPEPDDPDPALKNAKREEQEIRISEFRSNPVFVKTEEEDKPQIPQIEEPIIILDEEDEPEPQTEARDKTQEAHSDNVGKRTAP